MARKFQYAFGWLRDTPDHRDYFYTAQPARLKALPAFVDLQEQMPQVYNQGSIGSCGPNTLAALLEYDERRQGFQDPQTPSRLFLYWNTRYIQGTVRSDSGVSNRTMIKALVKYGYTEEVNWPYQVCRYQVQPDRASYKDAYRSRVDRYERVPQALGQMKAVLADGFPLIFGFSVYSGISKAEKSGEIQMPSQRDRFVGGHDVLLVGYDDLAQRFLLRNSWGEGWGRGGYGTIPYGYATNPNLSADFWTVRFVPDDERVASAVRKAA